MRNLEKRYQGCIIGHSLGNALGLPCDGKSPGECGKYIISLRKNKFFSDRNMYKNFGQYSQDTQLTREMMISFVNIGYFDPDDYATRLIHLFDSQKIENPDDVTSRAVQSLKDGKDWGESGILTTVAENGSARRTAAVGLFYPNDPDRLIYAAHDQSCITHRNPQSIAGSIAVAGMVSLALTTDQFDLPDFLHKLSIWASVYDTELGDAILELQRWLSLRPDQAVLYISQVGIGQDKAWNPLHGITPFVTTSVLWSLYSFLKTPHDYWQTLQTAICAGGDVHSMAAMAGAMSGAWLGIDVIPPTVYSQIHDHGEWKAHQLMQLANNVYEIVHK